MNSIVVDYAYCLVFQVKVLLLDKDFVIHELLSLSEACQRGEGSGRKKITLLALKCWGLQLVEHGDNLCHLGNV